MKRARRASLRITQTLLSQFGEKAGESSRSRQPPQDETLETHLKNQQPKQENSPASKKKKSRSKSSKTKYKSSKSKSKSKTKEEDVGSAFEGLFVSETPSTCATGMPPPQSLRNTPRESNRRIDFTLHNFGAKFPETACQLPEINNLSDSQAVEEFLDVQEMTNDTKPSQSGVTLKMPHIANFGAIELEQSKKNDEDELLEAKAAALGVVDDESSGPTEWVTRNFPNVYLEVNHIFLLFTKMIGGIDAPDIKDLRKPSDNILMTYKEHHKIHFPMMISSHEFFVQIDLHQPSPHQDRINLTWNPFCDSTKGSVIKQSIERSRQHIVECIKPFLDILGAKLPADINSAKTTHDIHTFAFEVLEDGYGKKVVIDWPQDCLKSMEGVVVIKIPSNLLETYFVTKLEKRLIETKKKMKTLQKWMTDVNDEALTVKKGKAETYDQLCSQYEEICGILARGPGEFNCRGDPYLTPYDFPGDRMYDREHRKRTFHRSTISQPIKIGKNKKDIKEVIVVIPPFPVITPLWDLLICEKFRNTTPIFSKMVGTDAVNYHEC